MLIAVASLIDWAASQFCLMVHFGYLQNILLVINYLVLFMHIVHNQKERQQVELVTSTIALKKIKHSSNCYTFITAEVIKNDLK